MAMIWLLLFSTLTGVALGCDHYRIEGYNYATCNGVYNLIPNVQCEGKPTYQMGARYLFFKGQWKISNTNCVGGYFHLLGQGNTLDDILFPAGKGATCDTSTAETPGSTGCEQFEVEGYSYAGCNGIYNLIPDAKCGGKPTYKKDAGGIVRYLFYHGQWKISSSNCVGGYFHLLGQGDTLEDLQLPEGKGATCKAQADAPQTSSAPGCDQFRIEGHNYAKCNGLYNIIPDVQCAGRPTYKKDADGIVRYLYFKGQWKISNANCVGGYFFTLGGENSLEDNGFAAGKSAVCEIPTPETPGVPEEPPYSPPHAGCAHLKAEGFDEGTSSGTYDLMFEVTCGGRQTYQKDGVKDGDSAVRYMYYHDGQWKISSENCDEDHMFLLGGEGAEKPSEIDQPTGQSVECTMIQPDVELPTKMIGVEMYYPMQEVMEDNTSEGWPNYADVIGEPTTVKGKMKKAQQLSGEGSYMDIGEHRDRCLGNLELCPDGYALTFGIYAGDFSDGQDQFYFSSGGQSADSHGVSVFTRGGNLLVWASTTKKWWKAKVPAGEFRPDEWFFLAVSWTESGGLHVYLNGENVASATAPEQRTLNYSKYNRMYIGAPNDNPDVNNGNFIIDNVMSFDLPDPGKSFQNMADRFLN